ncbi:dihydroorotate dehydrogenase [Bacillus sp. SA1-12]|uniref:dihydroorotate dehydrogenase n=1 Tax=Bacillus sp. SA1-12 TaxID=1455638 RepID=UPI0006267639|nr:dihydroorotate dehydrogenase [Bacillus sp. SA1-12]KKI91655.1 dihydroorotate dehydrogenase [Bacillus sp. SA1-12]
MPDWSYHPLFRPLFCKLPGHISRELIHKSMSMIASVSGGKQLIRFLGHIETAPEVEVKAGDLIFSSPVGLSGKVDPNLSGTAAFVNLGFSFIEIGPVTMNPSHSNVKPYYNRQEQRITFPAEAETLGLKKTVEKLEQFSSLSMKKIIRIKGSESEMVELAAALGMYGDIIVLEYSEALRPELISKIQKQLAGKKIFLSVQTDLLKEACSTFLSFFYSNNLDGVILDEDKSNNPFLDLLTSLKILRMEMDKTVPIITSGGVHEPKDAIALLDSGATLLLLSSGYITAGPGLPKRIGECLYNLMDGINQTIFPGWRWYWLFGLCILIGGLLALFFSMTRVVLPYDEAFLGITRADLLAFNENILYFMAHDRMTLSGTMISGGILYMNLAKHGIKYGIHWCRKIFNIAGITGFLGILLFIGYGYFDWLHGLFWLILLPLFMTGYIKTKEAVDTPKSRNDSNHFAWKLSLYGQLAFIILGAAFSVGGIVISYLGATSVFVSTDIGYLCLTSEMLTQYNEELIPVIAHDRAGFGSALLSVGLLVFLLSIWGFREGEKWVWWSLFIGGIPAFLAGIITHFVIGYTTFIHLLPAYIAIILYVFGLILSFPYLMRR